MSAGTVDTVHGPHLGRQTGSLSPSRRSAFQTLALGVVLSGGPAGAMLAFPERPWFAALLIALVGIVGLSCLAAGIIELLPGPGRLDFHENGFVHVLTNGDMDVYVDGAPEPSTTIATDVDPSVALGRPTPQTTARLSSAT